MKIKKTHLFLFIIILIHIIFILLSAGQLYYADETYFVTAAKEVASGQVTGRMTHFQGKYVEDKSDMLKHPPTYIYLLAAFIFLFGENPYSIRAVSALFAIGVIILIYLITKKILQDRNIENAETWALIASFLYAIIPIAIQSSIIVDIDGGLLNFFVLLFLYFYISKKNFVYLIPSLFMVFASKMLAPLMLFASLFLLNFGAKDYKEIWRIIKLFIISACSFFLSFFIYIKLFNLNWALMFGSGLFLGLLRNLTKYLPIARSLWGFKVFFYFATPFLIFLFLIVSYKILKNLFVYKTNYINENKDILLLWIYAVANLLFFGLMSGNAGWNFPKYYIAVIPSIIILIIFFTPKKIINIKKIIPLTIITSLLLLGYFIIFLGDPLIPESEGRVATISFFEVAKLVVIRIFMYAIVPIFLCIGLFERIPKKKMWLILLFLTIFTFFYLDVIQAKADYSTHNIYGDKGLKEVLDFMEDKPPEEILCYPHVGYFLNYTETYELVSLLYEREALIETLNNKSINWIILYQKDIDLIGGGILKDFELEKEIGSYKILKRKKQNEIWKKNFAG